MGKVKALLSNRQPILAVIVFSCLAISLAFRNVESVSIASLVSLPDGATPYGIVYDASRKLVWTVGYGGTGTVPASCLYRIDPVGKTYTRYFPSGDTNVWGGYFGSPHGVFEVTNAGTITVVFRTVLPVYVGTSLVGYYTLSTATEILGGVATTVTQTRTVTETKTITIYTTSPTTTTTSPTTTVTGTKIATGFYEIKALSSYSGEGFLRTTIGQPLGGMTVYYQGQDTFGNWLSPQTVGTDSNGRFVFAKIGRGNMRIYFNGYEQYLPCQIFLDPNLHPMS